MGILSRPQFSTNELRTEFRVQSNRDVANNMVFLVNGVLRTEFRVQSMWH